MSDPAPHPPRRERERLRHRQEILDAALRVCAMRGVEGVTVEHVAREAEFAVGSIYRHFRSKDELLKELVAALADRYFQELDALVCGPLPYPEKLQAAVNLLYDRHVESLPLIAALYAAPGPMPEPGTPGAEELRALRQRQWAILDKLLAEGQALGGLAPGNRAPMVLALTGLVTSFARAEGSGLDYGGDPAADVLAIFLSGCSTS